jgi:predicted ArsR family transcriptional regulator
MLGIHVGNPTREKIIYLLKRSGELSIEELSREMNITTMGIRQHLLYLERKGLVEYAAKRHGIGRPAFLYKLTARADDLFPKVYSEFIIEVLKDLETNDGQKKIEEVFRWRKERLVRKSRKILSEKESLSGKVQALISILKEEGYSPEISETALEYVIKVYNCPIFRIALEFSMACKYDLQMFRELLGKDVIRQECITDGSPSCTYVIPKA